VIIIFDSLAFKHVPTIKTLREYLVDEAKSKRGIDLAKENISALHAKVSPSPMGNEEKANCRSLNKVIIATVVFSFYTMLRNSYMTRIDIYLTFWYCP